MIMLFQVHIYKDSTAGAEPTITDMTRKLQRGPYYFARNTQGNVVGMWFSKADTAKIVMLKHSVASALHFHLPAGSGELLSAAVHYSAPHVDGHSTSVIRYKAESNEHTKGLTITSESRDTPCIHYL